MRAPVSRASSMSRWTISSSASAGQPGSPSSLQHRPSCITAPAVRRATSQCWASTMSRPSEYSIARRISSGSCTPLPSSVKIRTPASTSSANGASASPARPIVMHPAGSTSHSPAASPWAAHELDDAPRVLGRVGVRHRHDGREAAEGGGPAARLDRLGLLPPGLAQVDVEVDEPGRDDAAAGVEDLVAVADVGRRRRRCARPSTSTSARRSPVLVERPCRRGSATRHVATSMSRPEPSSSNSTAIRTATPLVTCWVITAPGQLGRVDEDLDAPVHRARVHHQGVVGQPAGPLGRQPEAGAVLPQARHERLAASAPVASATGTARRPSRSPSRGRPSPAPAAPAAAAWPGRRA